MRMVLGLDAPSAGSVLIDGKPYGELADPLRSVGALLDAKAIVGGRSAANHLKWLADSNGITRRRVGEVLDTVGLATSPGSGWGPSRSGWASAWASPPPCSATPPVVFDEPINGLDPDGILWIRNLMKSLAAEGRTVFLSSHLMSEMAQTADHLLVIARGRIMADASTDDFVNGHSAGHRPGPGARELADALALRGATVELGTDGALVVSGLGTAEIGGVASAHGITLYELAVQGASLEEAFFDLTRDETEYHAGQLASATKGN